MTAIYISAACALALPAAGAGRENCAGLCLELAGYANANGIGKIVIGDFAAGAGVEKGEAEHISGEVAAQLADNKKPELIDRAFFERVLRQARAAGAATLSPGMKKQFQGLLSVDAVLTGAVRAAGGRLEVLASLVDIKTGKVLFMAEAELPRGGAAAAEQRGARRRGGIYTLTAELPGILVPDGLLAAGQAALPARPADLRDAVADVKSAPRAGAAGTCARRRRQLAALNAGLVDAKARYWADKMKIPGSRPAPGENPGSEIADPEVKAEFYKLLAGYYKAEVPVLPEPKALAGVARLLEKEESFFDDCGH